MANHQEPTQEEPAQGSVLRTLLISDLVDSTKLVENLGDAQAAQVFARHDRLARDLLRDYGGREIDKTDGFLLLFERPLDAVYYALAYHRAIAHPDLALTSRVGIHFGEVFLRENTPADIALGAKPLEVEGLAKPVAARLMSLAGASQTLLTRGAFDLARRAAVGAADSSSMSWLAHGAYQVKGVDEPIEIFEVGNEGTAPLRPPEDSAKVRRIVENEEILGWRPSAGLEIPRRPQWILQKKLGEGGFGEVWLAAHAKTDDGRVFKFCFDAERLRALQREITLFRLLKETLGKRRDIVHILDWSFDAPPYFIEAEYSQGGSLRTWVESRGGAVEIALETRLDLVAQIAEALAAAHSVGVLHKDVKPDNIVIEEERDDRPWARLTDFGIAQITDDEQLAQVNFTVLGMTEATESIATSGTRLYMAPELLEGRGATVQADIYALGIVLYQMVVGDLGRALAPGWERDVDDPLLREDIASAVDGSSERRLGNALRLAERLRALPERREKRVREEQAAREAVAMQKALERSRKRRWLTAAIVTVSVLFAGAMGFQSRRVAREADRANREAESARQVSRFLIDLFEVSDPGEARGNSVTAREILDQGAVRITSELAHQPESRALLMDTIGTIYRRLGLYEVGAPLIEEALAERRRLYGDSHPALAESQAHQAFLLRDQGDFPGAETLLREALAIREDLGDPAEIAASRADLADVLRDLGRYDEAEPLLREALATRRELFGNDHPEVATGLNQLAGLLLFVGRNEESEPLFREALAIRRKYFGDGDHPEVVESMNNLGSMLFRDQRYDEAEPLFRESLAARRRLYGQEHPLVAQDLNNLGNLLDSMDDPDGAESLLRESLAMNLHFFGARHPEVANTQYNLASVLQQTGRQQEALSLNREVLATDRELLGDEHPTVGIDLTALVELQLQIGASAEEVSAQAEEAHRILSEALPPEHWRRAAAASAWGHCLTARRDFLEAEKVLLAGYEALHEGKGDENPWTRRTIQRLAALYEVWARPEEASMWRERL